MGLSLGITGPCLYKWTAAFRLSLPSYKANSGAMSSQRTRRPTAWEVSFPGESSEDENGDEEITPETESEQGELAVLNGKRKTSSNVDDRVRFVPFSVLSFN